MEHVKKAAVSIVAMLGACSSPETNETPPPTGQQASDDRYQKLAAQIIALQDLAPAPYKQPVPVSIRGITLPGLSITGQSEDVSQVIADPATFNYLAFHQYASPAAKDYAGVYFDLELFRTGEGDWTISCEEPAHNVWVGGSTVTKNGSSTEDLPTADILREHLLTNAEIIADLAEVALRDGVIAVSRFSDICLPPEVA